LKSPNQQKGKVDAEKRARQTTHLKRRAERVIRKNQNGPRRAVSEAEGVRGKSNSGKDRVSSSLKMFGGKFGNLRKRWGDQGGGGACLPKKRERAVDLWVKGIECFFRKGTVGEGRGVRESRSLEIEKVSSSTRQ